LTFSTFSTFRTSGTPTAVPTRTRRLLLATIAAATVASTFALAPVAASAAPVTSAVTAPAAVTSSLATSPLNRSRAADPIAEQAALALALWRKYEDTGDVSVLASFSSQRDAVAAAVAARLLIDSPTLQRAWAAADAEHQVALTAALSQLGVPYRRNTSKEGVGFDCSGLTTYAWGKAGFVLTRQSTAQIRLADPRTFETAQAGDLVQYPGHVMMWLGVGKAIVHSPYPGRDVEVTNGPSRKTLKVGDPTV